MSALNDIQAALVGAWAEDTALTALIGAGGVFDAPPKGRQPPYVTILRHDAAPRDGDETPGLEHRLVIHCWSPQPSRRAALEIAERVVAVGAGALAPVGLMVTHAEHMRTETSIDTATGQARAAVTLRFFSE